METLNKIQKELKAPKGQMNSFGGYKYRSCEDILEAVKPLLGDAVLTISDEMVCIGSEPTQVVGEDIACGYRFYVKATATITEGDKSVSVSAFARESITKKGMDTAQITGATSSYARKYALNGLFLIDDTKDADTMDNSTTSLTAPKKGKETPVDKFISDLEPEDDEISAGLLKLQQADTLRNLNIAFKSLSPMVQEKLRAKATQLKAKFQ